MGGHNGKAEEERGEMKMGGGGVPSPQSLRFSLLVRRKLCLIYVVILRQNLKKSVEYDLYSVLICIFVPLKTFV